MATTIDMHSHSVFSDDARATVEQYLKWITTVLRKGHRIDGIVLTEHRGFDAEHDYADLSRQYDVLVLRGSELDTARGHFLVYGVSDQLRQALDFTDVKMDPLKLIAEAERCGGIAVPAHPGRRGIGLIEFLGQGFPLERVPVVELINGGSSHWENDRARALAEKGRCWGIGGSDAHFVSSIGSCLTEFERPISDIKDLVAELRAGHFRALRLSEVRVS
ncbi:MAG: PHP domain-containing protein [Chloroflexi bacterium]|nr:PHP domain-containing protein [Chloroflexota bacterium]